MSINEYWEKALRFTEIIRSRVKSLSAVSDTAVPYVMLSESTVNMDDTVVRKGSVLVKKPSIILPPHIPQFEGFEFDKEGRFNEENIVNFLIIRGILLPSLHYQNQTYSLDVHEEKLSEAITHYKNLLQQKEDVHTGLIAGPDDTWQFSVLIFICTQIIKNTETDVRKLMEEYRGKEHE